MPLGSRNAIKIPVEMELENTQQIINSLKDLSKNINPKTTSYKDITLLLEQAEKKLLSIQKKSSSGIINKNSITQLEKSFDEVFSSIEVAAKKMQALDFKELVLTEEQKKSFSSIADAIDNVRAAYAKIETDKLDNLARSSQQVAESFKLAKVDLKTDSFESSIDKIESKITSLTRSLSRLKSNRTEKIKLVDAQQSEIDKLDRLKNALANLNDDKNGELSKLLTAKGDKFKGGGKKTLLSMLAKLGLDDETLKEIESTSASKIHELFDKIQENIERARKGYVSEKNKNEQDIQRADLNIGIKEEEIGNLQNLKETINNLKVDPDVQSALQKLTQEIDRLTQENEKLKREVLEQTNVQNGAEEALKKTGAAAESTGDKINNAVNQWDRLSRISNLTDNMKQMVSRWMGFYEVLNLSRRAIRNIVKDIRELDQVMTEIAIVTNMTQEDLWNQMNTYQAIAREYAVSTKGVYEVSKLFYQQGLDSVNVMQLTTETLKMAKIAGLDYATATDYMTVAIRGFHLEMSEAQNVVDVYSNIASKSASSTAELANAMSKTASSAAAVGSSFENTTAMIALMVETTRESSQNIGSALKSIISRYGEMKTDPSKLVDSEGEALDFNKVDTALKSIGVSMKTANGQFRDFDDVILDLSKKWKSLDINTQRYVATVMAGNRQQSRFLALVSDYDRLSELTEAAANSQDVATLQTLKTLDSLESKIQNVKTAWQGFYANLGLENVFKSVLNIVTNILNRLNAMPKIFGKIPLSALSIITQVIQTIKQLGNKIISQMAETWTKVAEDFKQKMAQASSETGQVINNNIKHETLGQKWKNFKNDKSKVLSTVGTALTSAGIAGTAYAMSLGDNQAKKRAGVESASAGATLLGHIASGSVAGPWGAALGAVTGLIAALPNLTNAINDFKNAQSLAANAAKEHAKELQNEALVSKSETKSLEDSIKKLEELTKTRYDSNEAYEEWLNYKTQIAEQYPELVSYYTAEGEAVIDLAKSYDVLAESRIKSSRKALEAAQAELQARTWMYDLVKMNLGEKNLAGIVFGDGRKKNTLEDYRANLYKDKQAIYFSSSEGNTKTYDLDNETLKALFDIETKKIEGTNFLQLTKFSAQTSTEAVRAAQNLTPDQQELKYVYAQAIYETLESNGAFNNPWLKDIVGYSKDEFESIKNGIIESSISLEEKQSKLADLYLQVANSLYSSAEEYATTQKQLAEIEQQLAEAQVSLNEAINRRFENTKISLTEDQKKQYSAIGSDNLMSYIYNSMMNEANINYDTLEEWKLSNRAQFEKASDSALQGLYDFYNNVGEETYKEIISVISNSQNYRSRSEILRVLEKLGIDFNTFIGKHIISSLNETWANKNIKLQDNFSKAIAESFNDKDITNFAQAFIKIGDNNGNEIAARYLDSIQQQWAQLVTSNKNTASKKANAEFLTDTYSKISTLSDDVNDAYSDILTQADLATREGVQAAIDQIEEYNKNNEIEKDDTIQAILQNLKDRKEQIPINFNTEIAKYLSELDGVIESTEKIYKVQNSGFDKFSDMEAALNTINAKRASDQKLDFDKVFKFDATLGKYIYTVQGFLLALDAAKADLQQQYNDTNTEIQEFKTQAHEFLSDPTRISTEIDDINEEIENLQTALESETDIRRKDYLNIEIEMLKKVAEYMEQEELTYTEAVEKAYSSQLETEERLNDAQEIAESLLEESYKNTALKSIDFSAIATGAKKFEDVKQSILNYLTLTNEKIAEMTETEAEQLAKEFFIKYRGGGREAANAYLKEAGTNANYDTYNNILNQPAKVAESLLNKLDASLGTGIIQLSEEERAFLSDKGLLSANSVGITAEGLSQSYDTLINTLNEGLHNNIISLETYNAIIAKHQTNKNDYNEYAKELSSFLTGTNFTLEAIGNLAFKFGTKLKTDVNFDKAKAGIATSAEGIDYISDIDAFLDWLNESTETVLPIEEIKEALTLSDNSKIIDAAVSAQNSIIEQIASNINNIKNAKVGTQVNLTYLRDLLGDDILTDLFGEAYSEGILIVNEAIKQNNYANLFRLKNALINKGTPEALAQAKELESELSSYIVNASNELSNFTKGMVLSQETTSTLRNFGIRFNLENNGQVVITTAQDFLAAAKVLYNSVKNEYRAGKVSLEKVNNDYLNLIKNDRTNLRRAATSEFLSSISGFSAESLKNLITSFGQTLDTVLTENGDVKEIWSNSIRRNGNSYEIISLDSFISDYQKILGYTIETNTKEYIEAYYTWLQSSKDFEGNSLHTYLTSLSGNFSKLSIEQAKQITELLGNNLGIAEQYLTLNGNGTYSLDVAGLIRDGFAENTSELNQVLKTSLRSVGQTFLSAVGSYISESTEANKDAVDKALEDAKKEAATQGKTLEISDNFYEIVAQGGEAAVKAIQDIANELGLTLSDSDIVTYYRSEVSKLEDAKAQLDYGIGSLVSGKAVEILRAAGYVINNTTGAIEVIGNIEVAYREYLKELKNSGEATLAAINEAQAKILELESGQELVSILGDAASMSFTRLGDILASKGIELTEVLVKEYEDANIIKNIGGGNIRVLDFEQFAEKIGLDIEDSETYTSAFKSYNDSLVDLNRKAERNITEELQNAVQAQKGDWVNLTQLVSQIPEELINQVLSDTNAVVEGGILKLDNVASEDIALIVSKIVDITASSGILLENEILELRDSIDNLLKSYIDLFRNGISGTLSKLDSAKLGDWAKSSFGLNLNFVQTVNGLKLSNDSAISLYNKLKQVDSLSARLVFDDLVENLQKSDERFSNISNTLATINRLNKELNNSNGINTAELAKQLDIAQEIARVQAADASQYKFMDRSLPEGMQGVANYWDSWGDMFKALNTAGKSGYMEIQDFYNIVNEMTNLASMSGQDILFMGRTINSDAQASAQLIEEAMSYLTNIDGEGVKLDLSKFGQNIFSGTEDMLSGFEEGKKAFAQANIDMLDALIQMLEAIVAFEELGKIDINKDGLFDWHDMFKTDENGNRIDEYLEEYNTRREKIIEMGKDNADFQAALQSFSLIVGEKSFTLSDILTKSAKELDDAGFSFEQQMSLIPEIIQTISGLALEGKLTDINAIAEAFANLGAGMSVVTDKANITLAGGYQLKTSDGGQTYTVEGVNGTFTNIDKAIEASIIRDTKDVKEVEVDGDNITGKMELGQFRIDVTMDKEGLLYTYNGETARSREGLYKLLSKSPDSGKKEDETPFQWAIRVGITSIEITPSSYHNINKDLREQLESALDTGDTTQVQALIDAHLELKDLQGLSQEEILKKIGKTNVNVGADTTPAQDKVDEFKNNTSDEKNGTKVKVGADTKQGEKTVRNFLQQVASSWANISVGAYTNNALSAVQSLINNINQMGASISVSANVNSNINDLSSLFGGTPAATGNVALAKGRKTLMGELGPELVVSNGRYFIAGQNGAEFVNLADDAIVFNHLQTKHLLQSGSAGRGKAVVSDKKAVSLATGNIQGPAKASASAALAELKKIRAMWSALLDASISDLGSKAGMGKGGGGGGKDKDKGLKLDSGYIKDLERWYNLLRKIERVEQDINYEEKLRSKYMADSVSRGKEITQSYIREFKNLQSELSYREELAGLKKGYYEQKMQDTAAGPWGQIFTFDENGAVQIKEGALRTIAEVFASDETGAALHSARQQYQMLQDMGYGQLMQYKDDGSRIEWTDDEGKPREEAYKEAVEAFSSHMDSYSEELQSLREEYMNEMESLLDIQIKQNEIANAIRDNQIDVEQKVMDALVESREREIDELQKQRDTIADSTDKFINGLTDQMNKEREMYESQQSSAELIQLRRQLAILQRSGGSSSQIRNLQKQIEQREQEAYFEEQASQIDAIKEASDLELERLDAQISLMQETLEYQKTYGLLWDQVKDIMDGSPEEIADYIASNTSEYWGFSETTYAKEFEEMKKSVDQWVEWRTENENPDKDSTISAISDAITQGIEALVAVKSINNANVETRTVTGDWNPATTTSKSSGTSGGSGNSGTSSAKKSTSSSTSKSTNSTTSSTKSVVGDYKKEFETRLAEHGYTFNFNGKVYSDSGFSSRSAAQSAAIAAISSLAASYPGTAGEQMKRAAQSTIAAYKKGGIIDYTGPAWVDGSKKKPEGVLNAEQLNMLRNMVLTPKNPLTGLLSDLSNSVGNTASSDTYNSINTNGAIIIENASVNMNVQKISNDYDTKRAMDTAMERMIEIARKSSTTSVRR